MDFSKLYEGVTVCKVYENYMYESIVVTNEKED